MTKCKLEYIWLDGYQPTQSLRSKTKIIGKKLKSLLQANYLLVLFVNPLSHLQKL